jgi:hypothetical protein
VAPQVGFEPTTLRLTEQELTPERLLIRQAIEAVLSARPMRELVQRRAVVVGLVGEAQHEGKQAEGTDRKRTRMTRIPDSTARPLPY